jgi:hypothetical protein
MSEEAELQERLRSVPSVQRLLEEPALRAAEAALGRGDLAGAESEAQAASQLAPWDAAVAGTLSRIGGASRRASLPSRSSTV